MLLLFFLKSHDAIVGDEEEVKVNGGEAAHLECDLHDGQLNAMDERRMGLWEIGRRRVL